MSRKDFDLSVYLVTDTPLCGERGVIETVRQAVRGGATLIQLREKTAGTRAFIELGRAVREVLAGTDVRFVINDRVDVALACGADGVHVGQSDMHPQDVRAILGDRAIVGLSIETMEQLTQAEAWDVDYYGVSPVFSTQTKTDTAPPWGLDGVSRLRMATARPLVGIGGIDAYNAASVISAGAEGVAVVSAICAVPSPEGATRELCRVVAQAR